MKIREAQPDDARLLAMLNRHVHQLHVDAEPKLYRATDVDTIANRFRELLDGRLKIFLIGEEEHTAMGYIGLQVVVKEGHTFALPRRFLLVDQIAVAPDARRVGVGRALMHSAESVAKKEGCSCVELDVRGFNVGAIEFYRALGYETARLRMARPM